MYGGNFSETGIISHITVPNHLTVPHPHLYSIKRVQITLFTIYSTVLVVRMADSKSLELLKLVATVYHYKACGTDTLGYSCSN
jgi:hypothetical protein